MTPLEIEQAKLELKRAKTQLRLSWWAERWGELLLEAARPLPPRPEYVPVDLWDAKNHGLGALNVPIVGRVEDWTPSTETAPSVFQFNRHEIALAKLRAAPPRPGSHEDPEEVSLRYVTAAVEKLWPNVSNWLGDYWTVHPEPEEVKAEFIEIVRYENDGYRMAKALDEDGWNADAKLVELCTTLAAEVDRARLAALFDWISEHKLECPFQVGAFVRSTLPRAVTGFVVEIWPLRGQCTVGERLDVKGGWILNWEELELASVAAPMETS